ncbi:MAG TPA: electron transfer flavoprotein subunit alpha, partial [Coriobacteriia bacterium]|nr:electron transfer flavoprotein subunit alpha [Coriobacteriia bacterium]
SGVFKDLEASGTDVVEELAFTAPAKGIERVASKPSEASSGADLQKAEIILCAGRGFAEEAELELIRNLATIIGGEVACTRPLTEGMNWFPKGGYLGVSGLEVTPRIYIGIGVSGQMQHMVGCAKAGTIIAINKDENAPIFGRADIGICGDLKEVIPALEAALN